MQAKAQATMSARLSCLHFGGLASARVRWAKTTMMPTRGGNEDDDEAAEADDEGRLDEACLYNGRREQQFVLAVAVARVCLTRM